MNNFLNTVKGKLTIDLYYIQMKWTLFYLAISFAVYFILVALLHNTVEDMSLVSMIFDTSKIYLLVIGIVTPALYMTFFIRVGITRKDFFTGNVIASSLITISILVMTLIVSFIGNWIVRLFNIHVITEWTGFLDTQSKWVIPFIVLIMIMYTYYLIGWIIVMGYYYYGGLALFLTIPLGLVASHLIDIIWVGNTIFGITFDISYLPIPLLVLFNLILIAILIYGIRILTQNLEISAK